MATPTDEAPPLDKAGIKLVKEVVGVFLYYARAVDLTMIVALSSIASAEGTKATSTAVTQLLNYAAIHLNATV
jgi:hypothetical protein